MNVKLAPEFQQALDSFNIDEERVAEREFVFNEVVQRAIARQDESDKPAAKTTRRRRA